MKPLIRISRSYQRQRQRARRPYTTNTYARTPTRSPRKLHFALRTYTLTSAVFIMYVHRMNPWWIPDTSLHRYWPESFIIFPPRRHNGAVVATGLIIPEKIIIMSIDRGARGEAILFSVHDAVCRWIRLWWRLVALGILNDHPHTIVSPHSRLYALTHACSLRNI